MTSRKSSPLEKVFADTSGLFSMFVSNDAYHSSVEKFIEARKKTGIDLLTTDYVLDETITLFKARKVAGQIPKLLHLIRESSYFQVVFVDQEIFNRASEFIVRHADHTYSFTDCVSFIVMKERKIKKALSSDNHFIEAGFELIAS